MTCNVHDLLPWLNLLCLSSRICFSFDNCSRALIGKHVIIIRRGRWRLLRLIAKIFIIFKILFLSFLNFLYEPASNQSPNIGIIFSPLVLLFFFFYIICFLFSNLLRLSLFGLISLFFFPLFLSFILFYLLLHVMSFLPVIILQELFFMSL